MFLNKKYSHLQKIQLRCDQSAVRMENIPQIGVVTAAKLPKALDPGQQDDIYRKLHDHMYVIFNAPCSKFPNFPFEWDRAEGNVSITAIIENFEEEQQANLIKSFNNSLRTLRFNGSCIDSVSRYLKATILKRYEGGIQFEAGATGTPERIMEAIKISECASLWNHVMTYADFLNNCQIRYKNDPFGDSGVRIVRFVAYPGIPICLMLWLQRQLCFYKTSETCGFGQVIISHLNGLPSDSKSDNNGHNLHFSCGLISWE